MNQSGLSTGYFDAAGRAAALGSAFSLAGAYFKQSGMPSAASSALQNGSGFEAQFSELMRAIRLRVAVEAARVLVSSATQINRRPSFRYERRREISRGEVRGTLDLNRLSQERGRFTATVEFPVRTLKRGFELPENVALCGSLLLVHRELGLSREFTGRRFKNAPEMVEARKLREEVERSLLVPWLADIRNATIQILKRGRISAVADDAHLRVRAGHTTSPSEYGRVIDWLRGFLEGTPSKTGGSIAWSFYGGEFDETLFEIWCLHQLRGRISSAFGTDAGQWTYGDPQPVLTSTLPGNTSSFSLYAQKSPRATVDRKPRWRREYSSWSDKEAFLTGIPDFTIVRKDSRPIFVDAKLRNRPGRPTEEIYKMLGYFDNYRDEDPSVGVIIYYAKAPIEPQIEVLTTDSDDQVLAFSVDPARPLIAEAGWDAVISLIERLK